MLNQLPRNKHVTTALTFLVIVALVAAIVAVKRSQREPVAPTTSEPQTAAPTATSTAAIPNPDAGVKDAPTLVLELFNPGDESLHQQLNETTIRQNIEQILSTSFVLGNCRLMDSMDAGNTFRAAVSYAINTKYAKDPNDAIAKIQELRKSAAASYIMLYRNTKCDDPKLIEITQQMVKWQNHYLGK